MTEEWRPVPRWEDHYQVSDHGRVRSTRLGTVLSAYWRNGYQTLRLKDGERVERVYVHRVVCEAWHGPPFSKAEAAHFDGTRTNNVPANLRWATHAENMLDKIRHGAAKQRGRHPATKLVDDDIPAVLKRLSVGERQRTIAADYGVTQTVISRINTASRRAQQWQ